jgi:eukaryotic-like serine/threonine-protein kinase
MLRKAAKIVLILIVFGVVAGIFAYLSLTFIIKSEKTVVVPQLAGKEALHALSVLSDLGLNTKISATESHPRIPKDHVIFQDPAPGAEIKKGRDVRLVVSKGKSSISIPVLTGLSLADARITIEQNGFCLGNISRTHNAKVKPGHVLGQAPPPNTELARGSCVDLLVSRGARPIYYKMPHLAGLTLQTALSALESQNLNLGPIVTAFDKREPIQTILKQTPSAGSRVRAGQKIALVVNRHKTDPLPNTTLVHRGVGLIRYRVASGFLRRHIQLHWQAFDTSTTLFDDFVTPGSEIWFLIPRGYTSNALLYVDNTLVTNQFFE